MIALLLLIALAQDTDEATPAGEAAPEAEPIEAIAEDLDEVQSTVEEMTAKIDAYLAEQEAGDTGLPIPLPFPDASGEFTGPERPEVAPAPDNDA